MDVGSPHFAMAHAVLGLGHPLSPEPHLDETFIGAVGREFPNVVTRQPPLSGLPVQGPRVVLTSSSSQLVLSAVQADFEVRFYGEYATDLPRAMEYIGRKLDAVRLGFDSIGQRLTNVGAIATFHFSTKESGEHPAQHILATHLRSDADPDTVQDAVARIALRARDKYFINLGVSNYESRIWNRPIMPGAPQPIAVKPWEGTVDDVGIELTVDVNNGLEGRVKKTDPEVTAQGIQAVLDLLGRVATDVGPPFVETGDINSSFLVEEPA